MDQKFPTVWGNVRKCQRAFRQTVDILNIRCELSGRAYDIIS